MGSQVTVFSQVVAPVHRQLFQRCVDRYGGDARTRGLSCRDQFLCMAFAQLTFRESLRDITACLASRRKQLYRMGIRSVVKRSTLADANELRDWRIYADLAAKLIAKARELYGEAELEVPVDETVYALDATTIDLCLNLFPWAEFRKTKAAVKMHTLLDLRGNIPTFIDITPGKVHDVNVLDSVRFEPGAFYVMDRGYLDFHRLYMMNLDGAFFVVRAKKNLDFVRHRSCPVERSSGVRSDHLGRLGGTRSFERYPDTLRRVRFYDTEQGRHLVFLTNNLTLPPAVIAELFKMRWQIELFFKWIKQHLRIKTFYGTSANAVKTQIWIAVAVYVLIAILRKQVAPEWSLHRIIQVLSVSAFEQVPVAELLVQVHHNLDDGLDHNQLTFNGF
jgi:hypothetical protein